MKKKKHKKRLLPKVIVLLILVLIVIGISKTFFKDEKTSIKNTTNIINNIADYGYSLDDRDTKYMKETFKKLEKLLNKDDIDMNEYASLIAELFVIDFYTLNNKINKYDVGSLEYILSEKQEEFKIKAMDTIYADIIDNTYKDRVQELPEIVNVQVLSVDDTTILLNDEKIDAIKVTMEYNYKKDLGYDEKGTVYLVRNGNKLEVALYNPNIE